MKTKTLLALFLLVLGVGSAVAKEPPKATPPQTTTAFDPSDFSMCKYLTVNTNLNFHNGWVSASPDNVDFLVTSCEGSDCSKYREIKRMLGMWDINSNTVWNRVGQALYATGKFEDVWGGSFAFRNAEKATANGMERCAVEVDLNVEIDDESRIDVSYKLGRYFYASEAQGGYVLQPVQNRWPTLVPKTSGRRMRYIETSGVSKQIQTMISKVTEDIAEHLKGQ